MARMRANEGLNDEEAAQLSEYVESLRPDDLGKGWPGPGFRGRPRLTAGGTTHAPSIHVRLPEDLYRSLSKRAGSRGQTVSQVVREILQEHAS
jgi:hypothetical protein